MIGYLRPLNPSPDQLSLYRSYQCGLCHAIGADYGFPYRLFAGPDIVFYAIFLDRFQPEEAPLTKRSCVVAPGVSSLPSREANDSIRLAAAFGIWMAVEKLRDDIADEGGLLKRLALVTYRRGAAKARRILRDADFPVDEIQEWLAAQRLVEASPVATLELASLPTRSIGRLAFGFAARDTEHLERAQAIGEHLGSFLFHVDNLLDVHRDLEAGGYNALARAFGLSAPGGLLPERAESAALDGAEGAITGLETALARLDVRHRGYLSRTLVYGFRDKVRRWRSMPLAERPKAQLRSLLPRRRPSVQLMQAFGTLRARVRMAAALSVTAFFPTAAWAEDWWPEDAPEQLGLDTGIGLDTGADTGPPVIPGQPEDTIEGGSLFLDFVCGSCCWFDPNGACDVLDCAPNCSPDCSPNCDPGC